MNHKHVVPPGSILSVKVPARFVSDLEKVMPLLTEAVLKDPSGVDEGRFHVSGLGKFSEAIFFVQWIGEFNDVIENLNLIISDMTRLPSSYATLAGSPKQRFYLLKRTYFHEFYRFRENHSMGVKTLERAGFLNKELGKKIRHSFHSAFESAITIRNNLVHGCGVFWKGHEYTMLWMVDTAWKSGRAIVSIEDGSRWTFEDVLGDLCKETARMLREEGEKMSAVLNQTMDFYVQLVEMGKENG